MPTLPLRYKANDDELDSNVATVSLSGAPVNDSPVATNASLATLEDTALIIDLGSYASDVDGNPPTVEIVTGPQYGTLTTNADGTPNANYNGADNGMGWAGGNHPSVLDESRWALRAHPTGFVGRRSVSRV